MTASFKAVMIGGVRWYQQHISANTPPCCKYYPTCSNYAIEALERYGAFKGGSARHAEITALPAVESWGNRRCSTTVFHFLQIFVVEGS